MQSLITIKTKIDRVLAYFLTGSTLNFIEAQQILHDRSLHSTVSTLQKHYGIHISRKSETIAGYLGKPTTCKRYWIELEERLRIQHRKEAMRKQKTQTTSVETKGMGFQMDRDDDTARINKSQTGLIIGA